MFGCYLNQWKHPLILCHLEITSVCKRLCVSRDKTKANSQRWNLNKVLHVQKVHWNKTRYFCHHSHLVFMFIFRGMISTTAQSTFPDVYPNATTLLQCELYNYKEQGSWYLEEEAGGQDQDHLCLHGGFEVRLDYLRHCPKNTRVWRSWPLTQHGRRVSALCLMAAG